MGLARIAAIGLLATTLGASACGSSTSPTTVSPILTTDVLTGTVSPPVNGVLQSAFNNFTVGQAGGSVTVTLTSAIETLPDASLLTAVTMGVGVGSIASGACTVPSGSVVLAQASSTPVLGGTLSPGPYCVQIYDVTNQTGPVAYTLAVSHP